MGDTQPAGTGGGLSCGTCAGWRRLRVHRPKPEPQVYWLLIGWAVARQTESLPSSCRGRSPSPWVGREWWAPHSSRARLPLVTHLNVGLGALAQELGHAPTLGGQQVPPLNPLWGGGWLLPGQVGGHSALASCRAPRCTRRAAHSPPGGPERTTANVCEHDLG